MRKKRGWRRAAALALSAVLLAGTALALYDAIWPQQSGTDVLTSKSLVVDAGNGAGGFYAGFLEKLGAEVTGGLEPAGTAADGRTLTCGRVGKLPNPMTMAEFLPYVAGRLHANGLRYVDGGLPVERIAVCGGSGGNMLELAAAKGCDTFVTADVKYNRFLAAKELGINLIDADHFCTENVVIPVLQEKLQRQFPDVTFTVSQVLHQTAQTYCP